MTIRIRRAKCDEAKPTCKRCATFDVICDGYTSNSTVSGSSSSTKRLLPRLPLSSCRHTTLQYTHSRILFKTEQEHRYLQIFGLQTAPKFIWAFSHQPSGKPCPPNMRNGARNSPRYRRDRSVELHLNHSK